jgi:3'-phosphoadenosine 5'-phosphosulfate sulfotransferase (PAPS reductase)/FAD synthetase
VTYIHRSEPFPALKMDAETLVTNAIVEYQPSKMFALFSGGNDSSVLTSWARINFGQRLDAAVYIDTGTALPGVREFVEAFCANRYLPLIVLEAGDAYQRMVRKYGVSGPGAHLYPYVWLKERQLDKLIRENKTRWNDRIILLSGARRAESKQRMGTAVPVERDGCTVWVNPLIDWTDADMRAYREHHGLEQSDVAALIHRSGECNCGAFADDGEREMLRSLYPDWWERVIGHAEREAEARGLHSRWGERPPNVTPETDRRGRLCGSCPTLFALEAT